MAIGSKNLDAASLRERSDDELVEELGKAKESLFNLRFQGATGQLESHGRLKAVRRDIARIYTVMRERELGIVAVVPVDTKADKAEKAKPSKKAEKAEAAEAAQAEPEKKAAPKKRAAKKAAAPAGSSSPSAEKSASDEDGAE
ncbi:50S ribosomal protein L29 [Jiangella asiatica]|uniref:Large ribosomal subunit protein uL29 n=1 Tax=Jiangella asiatica TaxID=2530372 RepID=A0A4R5CNF9_9ACTN|nr:50S ribosomal protein L29 [Jiangella asiatica]